MIRFREPLSPLLGIALIGLGIAGFANFAWLVRPDFAEQTCYELGAWMFAAGFATMGLGLWHTHDQPDVSVVQLLVGAAGILFGIGTFFAPTVDQVGREIQLLVGLDILIAIVMGVALFFPSMEKVPARISIG